MLALMRALVAFLALVGMIQPLPQQPIAPTPLATLSYGALLTYGPHAVGWRFDVPVDRTRTYAPSAGDKRGAGLRPVPVTTFYPALVGSGEESTFGALAELSAFGAFADPPQSALEGARRQFGYDVGTPAVASQPIRARRNATPVGARHPLILFAHADPAGQTVMSEYLASHGFVVAGVISKGESAGAYRL